ncbi:unnamed protein product [Jaminaea pallidilutea]
MTLFARNDPFLRLFWQSHPWFQGDFEDHFDGGTITTNSNGRHNGTTSPRTEHTAVNAPTTRGLWPQYLSPRFDLHEEDSQFKLSVELAGTNKDDIKVSTDERARRLTISGEVKSEYDSSKSDKDSSKNASGNGSSASSSSGNKVATELTIGTVSSPTRRPLISERLYGSFSRSVVLPETAALDKVTASFKDGILNVKVPKKAPEVHRAKTVTISDGDD